MQTLAQRLGRAIADHLKMQDEMNAHERTEPEAESAIKDYAERVVKLTGKQFDNVVSAGTKRYMHVPAARNGSTEEVAETPTVVTNAKR